MYEYVCLNKTISKKRPLKVVVIWWDNHDGDPRLNRSLALQQTVWESHSDDVVGSFLLFQSVCTFNHDVCILTSMPDDTGFTYMLIQAHQSWWSLYIYIESTDRLTHIQVFWIPGKCAANSVSPAIDIKSALDLSPLKTRSAVWLLIHLYVASVWHTPGAQNRNPWLINVCGIHNMNNYSFSPHPPSFVFR